MAFVGKYPNFVFVQIVRLNFLVVIILIPSGDIHLKYLTLQAHALLWIFFTPHCHPHTHLPNPTLATYTPFIRRYLYPLAFPIEDSLEI